MPLYYVSKLARDIGTIVVQVGEGADEIFSGYENYVRLSAHIRKVLAARRARARRLRRAASALARPALEATGRKRAAIELIRRLGANEPLFWGGVVVYDETFKPRVLSAKMRERLRESSSLDAVSSYLEYIARGVPPRIFSRG